MSSNSTQAARDDTLADEARLPSEGRHRALVWLMFAVLVGTAARVAYVNHPLDYRLLSAWHEADYTQIARNYYREDMNLFYPRIDWRGDTPGYVEMEFPLQPWVAALLYRLLGYHEVVLRALSALLGIGSLIVFAWLSWRLLPGYGAVVATAAFALNPQLVAISTAMQPEAAVVFFSVVAVSLVWSWEANPRLPMLLAAAVAVAAAMLAKLPAAYLGLILAYAVIRTLGMKAFVSIRIYLAAAIAVLPALAWYAWAAHFWTTYGNSMGVSNESHFVGLDVLIPPRFLIGNLRIETLSVFTPAGWLLALAALRAERRRFLPALVWYGAVCAFYLAAARTSGDGWAWYYHSISVAPACLLMGAGAAAFAEGRAAPKGWAWLANRQRWLGALVTAGTIAMLVCATAIKLRNTHHRESCPSIPRMYRCAKEFVQHVPERGAIVVSGGQMFDEHGRPVAHDRPMMFAWMDRKGFCYGDDELSIGRLDDIAARGGRYWIVHVDELKQKNLSAEVAKRYRLLVKCESGYCLYDLCASRPET